MITGKYEIIANEKLIAESSNIITASGLDVINKFLASGNAWAQTMRIGASYTPTSSSDVSMAYETAWATTTTPTASSGSITLTATFLNFSGEIYEIGIIPDKTLNAGANISNFDNPYGTTSSSSWYNKSGSVTRYAQFDSVNSRVGSKNIWVKTASAYSISGLPITTSNWSASGRGYLDLLYFVPKDSVGGTAPSLTFIVTDPTTSSITWKTITSSINVSASGYQRAFVQLGTPDSGFKTNAYPSLFTASFVGGTGSISLDAIYYRNTVRTDSKQYLLSRTSSSSTLISKVPTPQKVQIKYVLQVI